MAEVGERKERAEGRERRRAQAREPVERTEETTGVAPQLQRALMKAAAAALAGGLAGAAKAVADRRGGRTTSRRDEDAQDDDIPEEHDEPPKPDVDAASGEQQPPTSEAEEEQHADDSETSGAPSVEVAQIIDRARQEVEQILGCEAEGVSGIERSNGRWSVTVEVVELRRVPESTDVLASYAVVLDGDGDLDSLERTRRYRRSQVEDG